MRGGMFFSGCFPKELITVVIESLLAFASGLYSIKSLKYIDKTPLNEWELPPHQELFSDLINDKFNETMFDFESVGEIPLHQFRNAHS